MIMEEWLWDIRKDAPFLKEFKPTEYACHSNNEVLQDILAIDIVRYPSRWGLDMLYVIILGYLIFYL